MMVERGFCQSRDYLFLRFLCGRVFPATVTLCSKSNRQLVLNSSNSLILSAYLLTGTHV